MGSHAICYDIPWNTQVEPMGKTHSLRTLVFND